MTAPDGLPLVRGGHEGGVTHGPLEMVADTVPTSVGRLRRFAVDACRGSGTGVDPDVVALLVSELATNALVHGSGEVRVRVLPGDRTLRVEISDGDPSLPSLRAASPLDEGGRGVALVDALSTRWGADPDRGGGKTVWFELQAD